MSERYKCRVPVPDCNLLFYDVETTGTNPQCDEIVEFAYILEGPDGREIDRGWNRVMPRTPENLIEMKLRDLNGFDPALWRDTAISPAAAAAKIHEVSKDAVMVAHRADFDFDFTAGPLGICNRNGKPWQGRTFKCCTMYLAWPLLVMGLIPDLKLGTIVEFLGGKQQEAHRASSDVADMPFVYHALMDHWLVRQEA